MMATLVENSVLEEKDKLASDVADPHDIVEQPEGEEAATKKKKKKKKKKASPAGKTKTSLSTKYKYLYSTSLHEIEMMIMTEWLWVWVILIPTLRRGSPATDLSYDSITVSVTQQNWNQIIYSVSRSFAPRLLALSFDSSH